MTRTAIISPISSSKTLSFASACQLNGKMRVLLDSFSLSTRLVGSAGSAGPEMMGGRDSRKMVSPSALDLTGVFGFPYFSSLRLLQIFVFPCG